MTEFREGDLVRITATGNTGLLQYINPETDRAARDAADEYWAVVHTELATHTVEGPEELELIMTAKQARERKLPTETDVAKSLALSMHAATELNIIETDVDGVTIEAVGYTDEGLRFMATLHVDSVVEDVF